MGVLPEMQELAKTAFFQRHACLAQLNFPFWNAICINMRFVIGRNMGDLDCNAKIVGAVDG